MSPILSLLRGLSSLDRERKWLMLAALAYAASGLFHVIVWAVDGGAWAGDVSWRKPIVFGLSGAITTASLAWALGAVRPGHARTRDVKVYLAAMTTEIGLITMQRWRGVASHFNDATLFDSVVFQAMGGLILVAAYPTFRWAVQVTRDRALSPERRVAVAAGLWLLLVGVAVGIAIAVTGSTGRSMHDPALAATARALVPAHAVGLHGIQVMMVLSWVLPRTVSSGRRRVGLLLRAAIGTLALVFVAAALAVAR